MCIRDRDELVARFHPNNPKDHAVSSIAASFSKLDYREPVMLDERSGLLAAGHGRVKALASMQQQQMDRPDGIQENGDGAWLVPVVCGSEFTPEQLSAYLVASNNLTIEGGWNEPALAELLQGLAAADEELLTATGYDGELLDELLRNLGADWQEAFEKLPEGDRSPFQQMTFTLHDDQIEVVGEAIRQAKQRTDFGGSANENSNGNALVEVCSFYLGGSNGSG